MMGTLAGLKEYYSLSDIFTIKATEKYMDYDSSCKPLTHINPSSQPVGIGELHPVQKEQDDEQDIVKAIIAFCSEPKSAKEIVEKFAFPNRLYLKRHFLDEMLMNKKLKMTLPDKPSSRNQKYYS